MKIEILPPDPDWPAAFQRVKAALMPALPPGALVHHIGSTAVAGLAAKNIIDVQVSVTSLQAFDDSAMTRAGFERRRPVSDHCPPGLTLPAVDLQKRLFGAERPHHCHVHVREIGRFNQRYPLLCRDYLRAHPLAAAAYARLKINLAAIVAGDMDAYYDVKDPVFDIIMAGAEGWAGVTGWTAPDGD